MILEGFIRFGIVQDEKVISLLRWECGIFREPVFGTRLWLEPGVKGAWIKIDGMGKIGIAKYSILNIMFFRNWSVLKALKIFLLVEKLQIFLLSPEYPDRYLSKYYFGVYRFCLYLHIPVPSAFKSLLCKARKIVMPLHHLQILLIGALDAILRLLNPILFT